MSEDFLTIGNFTVLKDDIRSFSWVTICDEYRGICFELFFMYRDGTTESRHDSNITEDELTKFRAKLIGGTKKESTPTQWIQNVSTHDFNLSCEIFKSDIAKLKEDVKYLRNMIR